MEIKVKTIREEESEYIEIGCHKRDERVNELVRLLKIHQGSVEGMREEKQYQIPLSDLYYIEAVDERTFLYLEKDCRAGGFTSSRSFWRTGVLQEFQNPSS